MKNLTREEIYFRTRKVAKENAIQHSTVESYIKNVMPTTGLTWSYGTILDCDVLKIKLKHRRMIQIKFTRANYISSIQKMLPLLQQLVPLLDEIGSMNLRVVGISSTAKWNAPISQDETVINIEENYEDNN